MALNLEKLLAYFIPLFQKKEEIEAACQFVNQHFPDAKGFLNPALPPDYASFASEGSAYMVRFSTCKIHYDSKSSRAANPKYWYSQWTKEIDLSTPMRPTFIGYYDPKKKKDDSDDWRKKAAEAKKSKSENVDELLAATQGSIRRSDSSSSTAGSGTSDLVDNVPKPAERIDESEPSEPEAEAIKINNLDDIKKLNPPNSGVRKPKKVAKKKAAVKKVLPTKVIF